MNYFYKITHGFNAEDYIEINENEVEKAYGAFLQKKDAIFSGGAIKAGMIQTIKPNYHKTMGWNRGYKLGELDYEELAQKGIDRKMEHFLSQQKEKIQYLITTNQTDLIGKNIEIAGFEKSKEINTQRGGIKSIGEILK